MEEGQDSKEVKCENSEDGSNTSRRCQGNDMISVQFMQKILTEILGTYFMIFAGCGAVVVNLSTGGAVTFPGICAVWGLVVTVLVYSIGLISGTHLNPTVSSYVVAQVLGSTMASLTLRVVFGGGGSARGEHLFLGTTPAGSMAQAAALEFVISFFLMFVVSSVATDNRAAGDARGVGSMNPARILGPAMVAGRYGGVWVYVAAPVSGAVCGAWAYNLLRFTDKTLRVIAKSGSFLRRSSRRS
ncbi:aquaporin NIP1-2-like [Oryza glaberrima]|uniref:aquaporin NIP1-2-like n=1 Tax=Oryza glaberrima TaxID=4538 RepID=UPI00224C57CC|nr:aquaporin NIP1-2-like [Oryza glaberrima]